ncbi:hypothetical protein CEXT_804391, partial [Caerostris extrusa]
MELGLGATILPSLKPRKDPQDVTSYRPIALTSCSFCNHGAN